jgi:hypothetical protein
MRPSRVTCLILLLACLPSAAQQPNSLAGFQGYGWTAGAVVPDSLHPDFQFAGIADDVIPDAGIDLRMEEVTLVVDAGTWVSNRDEPPHIKIVGFRDGWLEFWRDPAKNHDYGSDPPNATMPSTFVDGTLLLRVALNEFWLYLDLQPGIGAFDAMGTVTEGLPLLGLRRVMLGGVLSAGGEARAGYTMRIDGTLEPYRLAAAPRTWGAVKGLYR